MSNVTRYTGKASISGDIYVVDEFSTESITVDPEVFALNFQISAPTDLVLPASGTLLTYTLENNINANAYGISDLNYLSGITGGSGYLRSNTAASDAFSLQAYDVDGVSYKTFVTLTSGDVPTMYIDQPSGTEVHIQNSSIDACPIGVTTPAEGRFSKLYIDSMVFDTATVSTYDATVTTLASVVVNENSTITFQATVSGSNAGASAGVGGTVKIVVRRASAGNVTIVGGPVVDVFSSNAATFTADVDTGTQTVRLRVTGVAATNYTWVGCYNYIVSTQD